MVKVAYRWREDCVYSDMLGRGVESAEDGRFRQEHTIINEFLLFGHGRSRCSGIHLSTSRQIVIGGCGIRMAGGIGHRRADVRAGER